MATRQWAPAAAAELPVSYRGGGAATSYLKTFIPNEAWYHLPLLEIRAASVTPS
jgi:hypothetical protein